MSRTILIVILTILVLIAVTLYWKKEEFRYQPVCGINPMGQFGANLRQMNERLESLGPMSAEERQNQIFSMLQQPQSVSANTFESVNQGQVPIGDISSLVQSFEQPINPFLQPMVQFPQQPIVQFPQQMVQQFPTTTNSTIPTTDGSIPAANATNGFPGSRYAFAIVF